MGKIGLGLYIYEFSIGQTMGGYAARSDTSKGVHDPITARAMYINNTSTSCLVISADFIGLNKKRVETVKEKIKAKHGIPIENILISVLHSHSSVLNINLFTRVNPEIFEIVDKGLLNAADQAVTHQFNGYLEVNKGEIDGVTFNRRTWDPLSDIINKEVVTVKIYSENGLLRGIWFNYSCHPVVLGPDNLLLSKDWVYYTEEYLKKEYENPDLFIMFLQGTPGNLNPRNVPLSGVNPPNSFVNAQEIGDDIASQMVPILKASGKRIIVSGTDTLKIAGRYETILIPMDDEDKEEFFGEFAEIVPPSENSEDYQVRTVVQGLKIGPLGIIGYPGEPFSEMALTLKKAAITEFLMVAGYSNDYIGYVGYPKNYEKGGYEMIMMALSAEEGTIMEEAALNLIKSEHM